MSAADAIFPSDRADALRTHGSSSEKPKTISSTTDRSPTSPRLTAAFLRTLPLSSLASAARQRSVPADRSPSLPMANATEDLTSASGSSARRRIGLTAWLLPRSARAATAAARTPPSGSSRRARRGLKAPSALRCPSVLTAAVRTPGSGSSTSSRMGPAPSFFPSAPRPSTARRRSKGSFDRRRSRRIFRPSSPSDCKATVALRDIERPPVVS